MDREAVQLVVVLRHLRRRVVERAEVRDDGDVGRVPVVVGAGEGILQPRQDFHREVDLGVRSRFVDSRGEVTAERRELAIRHAGVEGQRLRDLERLAARRGQTQLPERIGGRHLAAEPGVVECRLHILHQVVDGLVLRDHLERRHIDVLRLQNDLAAGLERVDREPRRREFRVDIGCEVGERGVQVRHHGDVVAGRARPHHVHVDPESGARREIRARNRIVRGGQRRRRLRIIVGKTDLVDRLSGGLDADCGHVGRDGIEPDLGAVGGGRHEVPHRVAQELIVDVLRKIGDVEVAGSLGRRQRDAMRVLCAVFFRHRDGKVRVARNDGHRGRVRRDNLVLAFVEARLLARAEAELFLRGIGEAHGDHARQSAGERQQEGLIGGEVERIRAIAVGRGLQHAGQAERLVGEAERCIGRRRQREADLVRAVDGDADELIQVGVVERLLDVRLERGEIGRVEIENRDGGGDAHVADAQEKAHAVVEVRARHRVRGGDDTAGRLDAVLAVGEAERDRVVRVDERGGDIGPQVELAVHHLGAEEADVQLEVEVVVLRDHADEQRIGLAHEEVARGDVGFVRAAGEHAELKTEGELRLDRDFDRLRAEARAGEGKQLQPVGLEAEVDRHRVRDRERNAHRERHFRVRILGRVADLAVDRPELDRVWPEVIERNVDRVEQLPALEEVLESRGRGIVGYAVQEGVHAVEEPLADEFAGIDHAVVVVVETLERHFVVVRRVEDQLVHRAVAVRVHRHAEEIADARRLVDQDVVFLVAGPPVVDLDLEEQRHGLREGGVAGEEAVEPLAEAQQPIRHRVGRPGDEIAAQQHARFEGLEAHAPLLERFLHFVGKRRATRCAGRGRSHGRLRKGRRRTNALRAGAGGTCGTSRNANARRDRLRRLSSMLFAAPLVTKAAVVGFLCYVLLCKSFHAQDARTIVLFV